MGPTFANEMSACLRAPSLHNCPPDLACRLHHFRSRHSITAGSTAKVFRAVLTVGPFLYALLPRSVLRGFGRDGNDALHLAVRHDHVAAVKLLIRHINIIEPKALNTKNSAGCAGTLWPTSLPSSGRLCAAGTRRFWLRYNTTARRRTSSPCCSQPVPTKAQWTEYTSMHRCGRYHHAGVALAALAGLFFRGQAHRGEIGTTTELPPLL